MTTYPKKASDLSDEPFFAIIGGVTKYIPGDELSRTNPGHGYPAHYEDSLQMTTFVKEDEWKEEIKKSSQGRVKFQGCKGRTCQNW